MENYDLISLGYICSVYYFKQCNTKDKLPTIFDNMAIPMWAVYDLLYSDFDQFALEKNMEEMKLFKNSDQKHWVDKKYYTRLLFYNSIGHSRYHKGFDRRIKNFKDKLNFSKKPILFIRAEEPHYYPKKGDRIIFPEHVDKYSVSEREYLKLFVQWLRNEYPNLNFKILHMTLNDNYLDNENGVLGIKCPVVDYRKSDVADKMKSVIESHQSEIDTFLT